MKTIAKPIQMIWESDQDGTLTPVRINIAGKDGQPLAYDVLRVMTRDFERISGNRMWRFGCEIDMDGKTRECEIKYEVDSCRWQLFKI